MAEFLTPSFKASSDSPQSETNTSFLLLAVKPSLPTSFKSNLLSCLSLPLLCQHLPGPSQPLTFNTSIASSCAFIS